MATPKRDRPPDPKLPAPKRTYRPRAAPQLSDNAFVFVELDRETGAITIDGELTSGPLEAYAMVVRAAQIIEDRLSTPSGD